MDSSFRLHLQTLQLFPLQQKNDDFLCTYGIYKPYSCSHAAEKQRFSLQLWHLQTLQLFPRRRSPAASLRCLKCRLVDKTRYIRYLRDVVKKITTELNKVCKSSLIIVIYQAHNAPPLRCLKCRSVYKAQSIRHLRDAGSCGLPEVPEVQLSR